MEERTIIQTRDLVKVYKNETPQYKALDGISLSIQEGKFTVVVGASGSGKSTLLHLLAGLERPTFGKIFVMQKPIHNMTEDQLTAFRLSNLSVIFQNHHLLPFMTVLDNVSLPLVAKGVSLRQRRQEAEELLQRMGLEEHLFHYPKQLSGSQQQRVNIARALITRPKILLADEPTGKLDSANADQIMRLLWEIVRENHMTLMMVTHDIRRAEAADRVVHIADGKVVG